MADMTREEAIEIITRNKDGLKKAEEAGLLTIEPCLYEAFEVAIEALEQEPCDDAISRQAVLDGIEELKKSPWATDKRGNGFEYLITEALDIVADLCVEQEPPVTPQEPKTGHWIVHPKGIYAHLICDKCLSCAPYDCKTNYCPNCGAKMDSEDWVNLADDLIPIMDGEERKNME